MKNTQDNKCLQCVGLCAVLLMGSYCISGGFIAGDAATYIINWLSAVLIAAFIWMGAAILLPRKEQLRKTCGFVSYVISLYFIISAGLYLRGLIALWRQWALPKTPLLLLAFTSAAVAVYGGSRGRKPVLRLCLPVFILVSFFYVMDTALLVPEMSMRRLSLVYGNFDAVLFLKLLGSMILPLPASILLLDGETEGMRPYFRSGAAVGLAYLLLSALRSVLLLGPLTIMEPYPLLRSLMLVYVGPSLNRMECWGLMALSAAMLASAMATAAGALSFFHIEVYKKAKAAAVTAAIAGIAFF